MLEAGFKADLVSYSTVSSACDKGSAWKSAFQIFTELSPCLLRADLLIYRTRAAVMFVLCQLHTRLPGPSQEHAQAKALHLVLAIACRSGGGAFKSSVTSSWIAWTLELLLRQCGSIFSWGLRCARGIDKLDSTYIETA